MSPQNHFHVSMTVSFLMTKEDFVCDFTCIEGRKILLAVDRVYSYLEARLLLP